MSISDLIRRAVVVLVVLVAVVAVVVVLSVAVVLAVAVAVADIVSYGYVVPQTCFGLFALDGIDVFNYDCR